MDKAWFIWHGIHSSCNALVSHYFNVSSTKSVHMAIISQLHTSDCTEKQLYCIVILFMRPGERNRCKWTWAITNVDRSIWFFNVLFVKHQWTRPQLKVSPEWPQFCPHNTECYRRLCTIKKTRYKRWDQMTRKREHILSHRLHYTSQTYQCI